MKVVNIVTLVLCLVLTAGFAFVALRTEKTMDKLEDLEASHKQKLRTLSDEMGTAYNRIAELELEKKKLARQVDALSSRETSSVDMEYQVNKIIEERMKGMRDRWQGPQRQWARGIEELDLKDDQVEAGAEVVKKGIKDWFEMQKKIKAGEITKEEAAQIMRQGWQDFQAKMKDLLSEDQIKKLEERMRNR